MVTPTSCVVSVGRTSSWESAESLCYPLSCRQHHTLLDVALKPMQIIDLCAISFEYWNVTLQPCFPFDCGEDGGIQLTVHVERVHREPMIRVCRLVVDVTHSSHHRVRTGTSFRCRHSESCREVFSDLGGPLYKARLCGRLPRGPSAPS